jgi:hypothetical protein
MRGARLNDADRAAWIGNDEALLSWQQGSGLGMTAFIRAHREDLDLLIIAVRDAPPPGAHLVSTGGRPEVKWNSL